MAGLFYVSFPEMTVIQGFCFSQNENILHLISNLLLRSVSLSGFQRLPSVLRQEDAELIATNNVSVMLNKRNNATSQSNGNNYMAGEPRRKREPPARPNHILLYTIINPAYPITVVSNIAKY
ncbi:hypothetical protein K1T71_013971 [Dendrolimus kikuchii]|uniref:Uncharacterized protein n=1 Tax=Dendrolimus kikuchii TaxID=765133 RepID=A0ACC1CG69_9NEOP|nr:hypothetical protein K1T71_013971 [Dendrolimus kikuchii]